MKLRMLNIIGFAVFFVPATMYACLLQPPQKMASDSTETRDVGETLTLDGTGKFYCPDSGQIVEYYWILPPEAYQVQGVHTSTLQCKFSPSTPENEPYEIELIVRCEDDLWNTDDIDYPSENRYIVEVTVNDYDSPWYVSVDGDDTNNGQSFQNAFRTIQTAIDSASNGHEIAVFSGDSTPAVYYEQLDMKGKSLYIHSQHQTNDDDWELAEKTIIDAQMQGTPVLFRGNETEPFYEAVNIEGITITGGFPAGDGLALHLALDETTNDITPDASGKGRDGTLENDPCWILEGYIDGALEFDGTDDYVEVDGYKGVTGPNSRTCAAWIKTSQVNGIILSWGNHDYSGKWIVRVNYGGQLRAEVQGGYIIGSTLINDGLWHHVAVVLENDGSPDISEAHLYVDGNLETISSTASQVVNTAKQQDVQIGVCTLASYTYFDGSIDDVRVYSRALSDDEIQDLADLHKPVAHWKMDEGSGADTITDASGNGYDGTIDGAASGVTGYCGNALSFDGSGDYVDCGDLNITGRPQFTVSAWINPDEVYDFDTIIGNSENVGQAGIRFNMDIYNNQLRVVWGDGTSNDSFLSASNTFTSNEVGQWHHVSFVSDGSTAKLYINGQQSGTPGTISRDLAASSVHWTIGKGFNSSSCLFNGLIDDVRIYKRTLDEDEIGILADSHPDMVVHYKFDDEDSGVTPDETTNQYEGLVQGDPTFTEDGVFGNACTFDGAGDFIVVDGAGSYNKYSISMWFNSSQPGASDTLFQDAHEAYQQNNGCPELGLRFDRAYLTGGYTGTKFYSGVGMADGNWHHIVGTVDSVSDKIELYVDGRYYGSDDNDGYTYPLNLSNGETAYTQVQIGARQNKSTYFTGMIDDVKIFDDVLSADEVDMLYSYAPTPAPVKELIAHYELDGDSTDSTGSFADGIVSGTEDYESGVVRSSLEFDGSTYIDLPGIYDPSESAFSFFMWLRLDEKSETSYQMIAVQNDGSGQGRPLLERDGSSDKIFSYLGNQFTYSETPIFEDTGVWHHVGLTYDGKYLSLYVDGKKEATEICYAEAADGGLRLGKHKDVVSESIVAKWNGAMHDIRIYNYSLSETEAYALYDVGGGIRGNGASAKLSKCIVKNNVSAMDGGGISNVDGTIQNCLIVKNESKANGGGLAGCDGLLKNDTIADNIAANIGGLVDCRGELSHLIIWGNQGDTFIQTGNVRMPNYSCLQDGTPDAYYNMNYSPYFVSPETDDYHLDDYSPCIDAGDDGDPAYVNEPAPNGSVINMGAFGGTEDATTSWTDTADGDGMPDGWENVMFGSTSYAPDVDTDEDGILNIDEYYAGTDPSDEDDYTIPSWWYVQYMIDPETDIDYDEDGLTNFDEFKNGTNPRSDDTDGDGIPDQDELYFATYIDIDPAVYDAYSETVGGIPAIWWYTWWSYCDASEETVIQNMKVDFLPSSPNAAEDTDGDGFSNFVEYQDGTDPTHSNIGDSWTEYQYDDSANSQLQVQYVVYEEDSSTVTEPISAVNQEYDGLGRTWRTTQKNNPDPVGSYDPANDAITLTEYYIDGSVKRTIRKGYALDNDYNLVSASPNTTTNDYQDGDIVVAYTYDALGRQETVTDSITGYSLQDEPIGEVTTYNYDSSTGLLDYVELPTKTGDPVRKISYCYDEIGRVVATVRPDWNYEAKKLDSMGRAVTSILYETVGDIDAPYGTDQGPSTIDIPMTQRRMEYDNLGTMNANIVMANAASTSTNYSTSTDRVTQNVVSYNDIDKEMKTHTYSDVGQILDSTRSMSDVDDDATGRGLPTLIEKGIALGETNSDQPMIKQKLIYNAAGQVISKTVSHFSYRSLYDTDTPDEFFVTKMEYDSHGRLVASIADGNPSITTDDLRNEFVYRGNRKVAQEDPMGIVTAFDYNAFGHMKTKTEDAEDTGGQARVTEYEYDRLGNLIKLTADDNDGTSPSTQETIYTYDVAGNVTEIEYPDSGTIEYVYADPAASGRPTQRIDQKNAITAYFYDEMGNLLQKQNDDQSPTIVETYTYDIRGLMLTAKKGTSSDDDAVSATTFNNYDGLGNVEYIEQQIGLGTSRTSRRIDYSHNQIGKVTQIKYPYVSTPTTTIDFTYTSLGQIDTIKRATDTLADYDYIGSMVEQRVYDTSSAVTFAPTYDDYGRIDTHTTENTSGVGVDFEYTYDNNGNITDKVFHHRDVLDPPSNIYGYDDLNRLLSAAYRGTGTESFVYDLLGNRNSVTDTRTSAPDYTYTDNNAVNEYSTIQIDSSTPASVSYDDNGNLTIDHRGYGYIYDYENRLIKIYFDTNTDGDYDTGTDRDIAEYEYDALGRRIEKVDAVANTTTRYYYDDQRVLLETDIDEYDAESDLRYFVYGNYIDEVLMMADIDSSNSVTDGDYYYAHDHLYSVVALFDDTGAVVERYEYDAYGKVNILSPNYDLRTTSSYGNPYTFTGRRLDTLDGGDLNLMYYRARTYDPQTGRFMQRDWAQYQDSMNLFEYVVSSPMNFVDPFGATAKSLNEKEIWDKVNKKYQVEGKLKIWLKFLGAKLDCKNGRPDLTKECNKKLLCMVRAISWVESRHGTGSGNYPDMDPMQTGNPDDQAWPVIIGKKPSSPPKREGKLPGKKWPDIYDDIFGKGQGSGGFIPDPRTMPGGHREDGFDPHSSYFWGIGWYLYTANQLASVDMGTKKSAWCCHGCKCDDMIKRAAYYNGKPESGKEGDTQYGNKIKDAVAMMGCCKD